MDINEITSELDAAYARLFNLHRIYSSCTDEGYLREEKELEQRIDELQNLADQTDSGLVFGS